MMETVNAITEIVSKLLPAIGAVAWPTLIFFIIWFFRRPVLDLFERLYQVKAYGVELVFSNLEQKGLITPEVGLKLSRLLSAHDIWALNDFAEKKINVPVNVIHMNAAQRVAARTLIDAGLLYVVGEGVDRHVELSDLGREVLTEARELPL